MSQTRTVQLNPEAVDALQELLRVRFRNKFGREPGPGDPVVFDPDADTPQQMAEKKHAQMLAEAAEAAGLAPHFIHATRQIGLIVTEHNRCVMPKQMIEEWERAIDEYFWLEQKQRA